MTHPLRNQALIDQYAAEADDPTKDPYGPDGVTAVAPGGHRDLGTTRPLTIHTETVPPRPAPADDPDAPLAPERESDDPAVLAAWYSGFAYAEHYRKVTLAECRELVRAQYAVKGEKVTEARLDDLARTHPRYLEYLTNHLEGRTRWEQVVRADGGMT